MTHGLPEKPSLFYAPAVLLLTVVAIVLRVQRLDHPMRYDEAFTFLVYVAPADYRQLFNYSTPNNHILHTLLVKLAYELFGTSPWSLRLPAFLAGVAIVPAVAALARKASGRRSVGVLAAALACSSSILIEYSVNARGYSTVCLLALAQFYLVLRLINDSRWIAGWVLWSLLTAFGALTIPIMLYPTVISALLFVLGGWYGTGRERCRTAWRQLLLAMVGSVLLTAILYTPTFMINGMGAVFLNPFVAPKPIAEVWAGLPTIGGETIRLWMRDTSGPWLAVVAMGVVCGTTIGVQERRAFFLLPILAPVVLFLLLLFQRVTPYPRVWLFLWPLTLSVAAGGLGFFFRALGQRWWQFWSIAMIAVLVLCAESAIQSTRRPYLISEDSRTLEWKQRSQSGQYPPDHQW